MWKAGQITIMNKVTFSNMNKRIKALSAINGKPDKVLMESAYNYSKNGRYVDIYHCIESCARSNKDISFDVYLELFDRVIETANESNVRKVGNFILENVIHKIRDSKKTQELIHRRMGRLKSKLKPNNPPKNIKPVTAKLQSTVKEEVVESIYNDFLNEAYICENYDRVAQNYDNISKRFNMEVFFTDHAQDSTADTVLELCKLIDTYTMSTAIKFNTVIESAWYGFESLRINYNAKEVLETAVDYFCFKECGAEQCKKILDTTIFYDGKDKDLDIFMEDEPEEEDTSISKDITNSINGYLNIQEASKKDDKKEEKDASGFNKLFNKFKKEELAKEGAKPSAKLRSLVAKLYTKNVDGIVEETPKFLSWIRAFFILGSATIPVIGPVLAAVGFIADRFIALHMERAETKQMITCFNNEIKATKEKINKTKSSEEKDNLKKYLKSLEDAKGKIDSYYNELLTDEEIDQRYEEESDSGSSFSDDFDFGDDFDFDSFEEFFVMDHMANKFTAFTECNDFVSADDMYNLTKVVPDESICDLATIASIYPSEFYKDSVTKGIEDHLIELESVKKESVNGIIPTLRRIDSYREAHKILDTVEPNQRPYTINEANSYLDEILEAASAISTLNRYAKENQANSILENSALNTLRMGMMKLKQSVTKMTDKEKNVSREIDRSANSLLKGVEKAFTTGNRESVLKGSIIPSASKIIKLALVNAGFILLNQPVLAVITTLGYVGVSHGFKNRERQLLIDEIEVELKMCQKYIDIAESKGDMKALKQCLTIQRNLQRQLQRIKYRMKVDLGRKHVDASFLDNVDQIGQ